MNDRDQEELLARKDKREVSPTSSTERNDGRSKKKRKSSQVNEFIEDTFVTMFNQGKDIGENQSNKKVCKRSIVKAKEMARKIKAGGSGEATNGTADVFKELCDSNGECSGTFRFGTNQEVNIRGLGECGKKGWIKSIIRTEKPDMIGIQETKSVVVDDEWVEDIWGEWDMGGILLIWDKRVFTCKEAIGDERFIAMRGSWQGKDEDVFLVCIYRPHVTRQKASLWDRLSGLMHRWQGAWCIFGDLNVVRSSDDRFNSQVNLKEASDFNDFINNMRYFSGKR
ncbi:RNA-directed DNA polymerase, eukaryota [Artemisia annua]|uniref:RNA-directed DNA polymerase, eukaryota n=1 Tax=Artemisia annua TaxID=35608 RepID=A0A2U1MT51_ARTAN|nr:RNA-directed DNA polymerase, eukaryota [Artemisia annua]